MRAKKTLPQKLIPEKLRRSLAKEKSDPSTAHLNLFPLQILGIHKVVFISSQPSVAMKLATAHSHSYGY